MPAEMLRRRLTRTVGPPRASQGEAERGVSREHPVRGPRFRSLFAQFAVSGLVAVLVVALGATFVLRRAGQHESVRDARRLTEVIGRSVIEPNLSAAVVRGDRTAVDGFDRLVRRRVIVSPVVRVKLWRRDGTIVYSDKRQLVGARYPLENDERAALASGRVDAGISDLNRPENRFERRERKLLEVYMPVSTSTGERLLFEAYLRYSDVAARGRRVWLTFVPALLAALLLLWLVQLPLALSLTRRLRREHGEREALLLQALNASDVERRRIAGDLHDGVVQDLAGTSYALAVAADGADTVARGDLADVLRRGAASTRQAMRQLRSLLVEIYPPNLREAGLEAALDDLVAGLSARGIAATAEVSHPGGSAEAQRLIFRTAQEALRNVIDHADARSCSLKLSPADGGIELLIRDDGRGLDETLVRARQVAGHLGLKLLTDRARDAGGTLTVESAPSEGTTVRLWLPTT